jgi:hypothetical protein
VPPGNFPFFERRNVRFQMFDLDLSGRAFLFTHSVQDCKLCFVFGPDGINAGLRMRRPIGSGSGFSLAFGPTIGKFFVIRQADTSLGTKLAKTGFEIEVTINPPRVS